MKRIILPACVFVFIITGCVTEKMNSMEEIVDKENDTAVSQDTEMQVQDVEQEETVTDETELSVEENNLMSEEKRINQKSSSVSTQYVIVERPVYIPENKAATSSIYNAVNSPDISNHGEMQYDYISSQVYEVYTTPLMSTDIRMQPGEKLIGAPIIGDSNRWEILGAISLENGMEVSHIVIKPHKEGLMTTLMLTTDRRTYSLIIRSFAEERTPIVSWRYPFDQDLSMIMVGGGRSAEDIMNPTADNPYVSFDYRIKRGLKRPHWTPEMVYDDGRKTYIVFRDGVLNREIPIARGQQGELLNTRLSGNVLIIDKLLEELYLVNGKEKIKIQKKG